MIGRIQASPLAPWAGLFLGAFGWFLHHQTGSDANNFSCRIADGGFVVVTGLIGAAIALLGGLISWSAIDAPAQEPRRYRSFARIVGVLSAAIFLLAIAFQILAGLLVPACLR
jgi:hypothetical protein